MRTLLPFLLVVMAGAPLRAQATWEAYANARQVLENGFFDITFSLKDGQGAQFQPPDFADFEVVSGPRRGMSTTIVNGQVSTETTYSYTLRPKARGRFRIGAATIEVDGKTLRSPPVPIEVIEAGAGSVSEDAPYYVRAIPHVETAYLGQQISLDYKLFTSTDIESYNVLEEADYGGFYAQDLKRFDSRVMQEIIDGKQYTTKVLKRVALFPQQAGRLTVDPMRLQLGIVDDGARRSGSFFFNRKVRRVAAATRPVAIRVLPLPDGAPEGFSGAVGAFSLASRLSQDTLTTDEVLSLRISITGSGDIKRVLPPAVGFPASFELYDPRVIEETSFEVNGRITSRKTFEYLAQPTEPGTYRLQPRFVYFAADSAAYRTLGEEAYAIEVRPGSARAPVALPEAVAPVERDIRYLKPPMPLEPPGPPFFGSPSFWTLSALPFLLFAGMLVTQRVKRRQEQLDPALRRQRRAQREARQRLQQARGHLEAGASRAFYDAVSKALLGYVSDKVQIPRSELSKDKVRERLMGLGVEPALVERFVGLLQTCEKALFAGIDQPEQRQADYEEATTLLTRIEQSLG